MAGGMADRLLSEISAANTLTVKFIYFWFCLLLRFILQFYVHVTKVDIQCWLIMHVGAVLLSVLVGTGLLVFFLYRCISNLPHWDGRLALTRIYRIFAFVSVRGGGSVGPRSRGWLLLHHPLPPRVSKPGLSRASSSARGPELALPAEGGDPQPCVFGRILWRKGYYFTYSWRWPRLASGCCGDVRCCCCLITVSRWASIARPRGHQFISTPYLRDSTSAFSTPPLYLLSCPSRSRVPPRDGHRMPLFKKKMNRFLTCSSSAGFNQLTENRLHRL